MRSGAQTFISPPLRGRRRGQSTDPNTHSNNHIQSTQANNTPVETHTTPPPAGNAAAVPSPAALEPAVSSRSILNEVLAFMQQPEQQSSPPSPPQQQQQRPLEQPYYPPGLSITQHSSQPRPAIGAPPGLAPPPGLANYYQETQDQQDIIYTQVTPHTQPHTYGQQASQIHPPYSLFPPAAVHQSPPHYPLPSQHVSTSPQQHQSFFSQMQGHMEQLSLNDKHPPIQHSVAHNVPQPPQQQQQQPRQLRSPPQQLQHPQYPQQEQLARPSSLQPVIFQTPTKNPNIPVNGPLPGSVWGNRTPTVITQTKPSLTATPTVISPPATANGLRSKVVSPQLATVWQTPTGPTTPNTNENTPQTPAQTVIKTARPSALLTPSPPHHRRPAPHPNTLPHSPVLDQQILTLVKSLMPTPEVLGKREACRAALATLISRVWPAAKLHLFGSSVNLLSDLQSDCDMCLAMGEESGVKQSCYNTLKPKVKTGKHKEQQNETPTRTQTAETEETEVETSLNAAAATTTIPASIPIDLSDPAVLSSLQLHPSPGEILIEPGQVVEKLALILQSAPAEYTDILALPNARVPIVKFHSTLYDVDCDIGINNILAVHNSALIRAYMCIDERVRQLTYLVKYWAKQRKINDPYRGTLSSYAYVIMVIHFCQQIQPPLLHCLQQFHRQPGQQHIEQGYDCWFYQHPASATSSTTNTSTTTAAGPHPFVTHNTYTLSTLFSAFLSYYAHTFNYHEDVLSIRVGGILPKQSKSVEWMDSGKKDKHLLSIEDPFEVSHDLGRVCDANALYEIRGEMIRGIRLLNEKKTIKEVCDKYEQEWRGS